MKWSAIACGGVLIVAACGADTQSLQQRVTTLEGRPPPPADRSHDLTIAEERIAELMGKVEAQQKRIADLEAVVHELGDQVADALANQPTPPPVPSTVTPAPPTVPHGLDPAKVYAVAFDGAPVFGSATAAVTLVASVQFPEPYTHKAWSTLAQLRAQYGADLRVAIEAFVVHSQATDSTTAACAVGLQGSAKLDKFEQELYDKVMAAPGGGRAWADAAGARALAKAEGVDMARFDRDLKPCKLVQDKSQKLLQRCAYINTLNAVMGN